MGKGVLRRDSLLAKCGAVVFSVVLALGMTPASAYAQPAQGGEDYAEAVEQVVDDAAQTQVIEEDQEAGDSTVAPAPEDRKSVV